MQILDEPMCRGPMTLLAGRPGWGEASSEIHPIARYPTDPRQLPKLRLIFQPGDPRYPRTPLSRLPSLASRSRRSRRRLSSSAAFSGVSSASPSVGCILLAVQFRHPIHDCLESFNGHRELPFEHIRQRNAASDMEPASGMASITTQRVCVQGAHRYSAAFVDHMP